MLTRQKILLSLLSRAKTPLKPIVFVKLMFLLKHETEIRGERTFYDFVPYRYGPFSFTLYRELGTLRRYGYVAPADDCVSLVQENIELTNEKIDELPSTPVRAVIELLSQCSEMDQKALLEYVYAKYPWFASKSELTELKPPVSQTVEKMTRSINTVGYEGKSVEAVFNDLQRNGIELVIDVRANPISRRYGFSKRQFSEIGEKLGIDYFHVPSLGIPSAMRADLKDFNSYQVLLHKYENDLLPDRKDEIMEVAELMIHTSSALICFEKDIRCCHRTRLASAISKHTGLEVKHI
jgi:uncharacterized protein (DUF488 family)